MSSEQKKNYHLLVPPPEHKHVSLPLCPSRLIVVGDVHGCLIELQQVLETCKFDRNAGDEVLLLGDLTNKGPLSAETVQYVRSQGFHCLRGNHDDFVLCHAMRLLGPTSLPAGVEYIHKLSKEDIDWLAQLPYTISIPQWKTICVHAGLVPTVPLEEQDPTMLVTVRNVVPSEGVNGEQLIATSSAAEGDAWVQHWHGQLRTLSGVDDGWHVIFGHDAKRGLQQSPFATGLDTGCAYGKKLTAMILPEQRVVQVDALAAYSPVTGS